MTIRLSNLFLVFTLLFSVISYSQERLNSFSCFIKNDDTTTAIKDSINEQINSVAIKHSITTDSLQKTTVITENEKHSSFLIGLGLGDCYFGITGYCYFSYLYNDHMFTLRYLNAREFIFGGESHMYNNPSLKVIDIGLLYGRFIKNRSILLSANGGIGFIRGMDRGKNIRNKEFEEINISTIGIPFEAKIGFRFWYVGISATLFGNINTKKSFSGCIIELSFGKL